MSSSASWRFRLTEVPEHLADKYEVGRLVGQTDLIMYQELKATTEYSYDGGATWTSERTPPQGVWPPMVPAEKAAHATTPNGHEVSWTEPAVHAGLAVSAFDHIESLNRAMCEFAVDVTSAKGRRVAVVTGEIDNCRVRVEVDVPADFDGVYLYSAYARAKFHTAAGRALHLAERGE